MKNNPVKGSLEIGELLKEFDKNYVKYTDAGTYVYFTGKNDGECGVDLDDFIKKVYQAGQNKVLEWVENELREKYILTLDLDKWSDDADKAQELFNSSDEIKNWNKAMEKLISTINQRKEL